MSGLAQALLATQQTAVAQHFPKDGTGNYGRHLTLHTLVEKLLPAAHANGLVVTQEPCALEGGLPALRTRVMHVETGDALVSEMPLLLEKTGPQGQGSAITYARRYALCSIFGIVPDADDDGGKAGASPSSAPQGQAADAEVSRPESPAPAAASPAAPLVEKAQAAAENLRANQRPDIPVDLGSGKFQVTTNVTFVDEAHGEKNGKPWTRYDVHISSNGDDLALATFSETLAQACRDLAGTTAHITYVEKQNGKYTNRTLEGIEPAPELAQAFAGIAIDDDIPFGPVIW